MKQDAIKGNNQLKYISECLWYKNGSLFIDMKCKGITVRKSLNKVDDKANVNDAKIKIMEIKKSIFDGTFSYEKHFPDELAVHAKVTNFTAYIEVWKAALTVAKSTKRSYSAAGNFWVKHFGTRNLNSILHSEIKTILVNTKQAGKTKDNYKNALIEVFKLALADNLVKKNPVKGIDKFGERKKKHDIDPFEREEAERILELFKLKNEQVYNYFYFQFLTGCRPSETIALKWSDFDSVQMQVHINKAIVEHSEKEPKTKRGIRFVDLDADAMAVLQAQKKFSFLGSEDNHIFQNPHTLQGWASDKKQRTVWWNPALKALGIRHRSPYHTRHSYASWHLSEGIVGIEYISDQLGHDSISVTEEYYGKFMASKKKEVLARRNNAIKRRNAKKLQAEKKAV